MRVKDLVERLGPIRVEGPMSRQVIGITSDSRVVTPGMVYVALPDGARDRRGSIHAAMDRGAAAVVSEGESFHSGHRARGASIQVRDARRAFARAAASWYQDPSTKLEIYAVTGPGASETALILKRLLCLLDSKAGLLTPTRFEVGDRAFPSIRADRDPLETQRLLAQMARLDCKACVIELGNDPLAEASALGLELNKLVICGNAEGAILPSLHADADLRLVAPVGTHLQHCCTRYGIGAGEIRAERLQCTRRGSVFDLVIGDRSANCTIESLGYQRTVQFLAAVAALDLAEGQLAQVARYARSITTIPGCLQKVAEHEGFDVYVDGARTPSAISRLLNAARPFTHDRLIIVSGASADDDLNARDGIGRALAVADLAIITTNDPRSEPAQNIAEAVLRSHRAQRAEGAIIELDRARAIETAIRSARKGDIILITGKGDRTTQTIAGSIVPFDDADVARRIVQYQQLVFGLENSKRDQLAGVAPV